MLFTLKIFIMANIIQFGKPYALLLCNVHDHNDQLAIDIVDGHGLNNEKRR